MNPEKGLLSQNGETDARRLSEGRGMNFVDNHEGEKASMGRDYDEYEDAEAGNVVMNLGDPK